MAKTQTRWSPDTCECIIDYEWDRDAAPDARVHDAVMVQPCALHAGGTVTAREVGILDPAKARDVFARVLEENQRKNRAVSALLEQQPALTDADVTWDFDADRRVQIACPKLDAAARKSAKARILSAAGDKVELV